MPKGQNNQANGNEKYDDALKKLKDDYEKIATTEIRSFDEYYGREEAAEDKEKIKAVDEYLDNLMNLYDHMSELSPEQKSIVNDVLFNKPTALVGAADDKMTGLTALQKRLQNRTLEVLSEAGPHPTEDQIKTVGRYSKFLDIMTLGGGKAFKQQAAINKKAEEGGYKKELSALRNENKKDNRLFEALAVFGEKADFVRNSYYFESYFNACEEIKKKDEPWKKEFLESRQKPIIEKLEPKEKELKELNKAIDNRTNYINQMYEEYNKTTALVQSYKEQTNNKTQAVYNTTEKLESNLTALENTDKSAKTRQFADMLGELHQLKEIDLKTGTRKSIFDSISHPNGSKDTFFKLGSSVSARDYINRIDRIKQYVDDYVAKKGRQASRFFGNGKKRYKIALDIQKNLAELQKGVKDFSRFREEQEGLDGKVDALEKRKSYAEAIKDNMRQMEADKEKAAGLKKEVDDLRYNKRMYNPLSKERISLKQMMERSKMGQRMKRSNSISSLENKAERYKQGKDKTNSQKDNGFVIIEKKGFAK